MGKLNCSQCGKTILRPDPRVIIAGLVWCADCVYRAEKDERPPSSQEAGANVNPLS